jgi:phosphate/sulfate permease
MANSVFHWVEYRAKPIDLYRFRKVVGRVPCAYEFTNASTVETVVRAPSAKRTALVVIWFHFLQGAALAVIFAVLCGWPVPSWMIAALACAALGVASDAMDRLLEAEERP